MSIFCPFLQGLVFLYLCSCACCSGAGRRIRECGKGEEKFIPKTAQDTTQRLAALRLLMRNKTLTGGIKAYIVPSSDPHQTEYVAAHHKRREFITGFTGSRGTAIVTQRKAAMWTDGRYFVQADMELDCNWTLMKEGLLSTPGYGTWLKRNIPQNSTVGVDPFLLSVCDWDRLAAKLKLDGITLVPVRQNLVDRIWTTRPSGSTDKVFVLELKYTGKEWVDKVQDVRAELIRKNRTAVVLQALDEIAWLFNLRGSDISYSPVFFSYAIVTLNKTVLFIDEHKVTEKIKNDYLRGVDIEPYHKVVDYIENLGKDPKAKIWITQYCSYALRMVIPHGQSVTDESPIIFPKAVKNYFEVEGMKRANVRDAVVICEYLSWLEDEVKSKRKNLTEISAEEKLLQLRKSQENYISPSFATISGFGRNSAIIHYKTSNFTDVQITDEGFYLLDTGGQYLDGTTDTTRTVHFGLPSQHEIDCFTRVLMGHLDVAMAVFPNHTYGRTLDVFARAPLWKVGLDYRHGTGHGIGHFLNVHEGPQCISPGFPLDEERKLTKGMILSDEPGYYEDEKFGVRLETAVLVESADTKFQFNKNEYLKFEPIIYVPFQRKLMNANLLRPEQIKWLNDYHTKTRDIIGSELRSQKKTHVIPWLMKETEPIGFPNYESFYGKT